MMKKIILIYVLFILCQYSHAQTELTCKELVAKGYTQNFCDYNSKYAYKNIPFESNFNFVASKFKLTKNIYSDNSFDCKDIDLLKWATVIFDNCIFDYSSSDKLDGIQLQLFNNSSTTIPELKAKIKQVKNYLTFYFGKPEKFPGNGNDMWSGDKIYIVVVPPNEKLQSGAVIAIYRKNINPVDDL